MFTNFPKVASQSLDSRPNLSDTQRGLDGLPHTAAIEQMGLCLPSVLVIQISMRVMMGRRQRVGL